MSTGTTIWRLLDTKAGDGASFRPQSLDVRKKKRIFAATSEKLLAEAIETTTNNVHY